MFLQQLDRFDDALAHCQRAVDLSVRELGWRHPTTMNMVENRASVLAEIGRTDEAEADARRVLSFFNGIGEPAETRTSLLLTLGRCALGRGDTKTGRDLLDKSLAARIAAQAVPLELAEAEMSLAHALWESGDRVRALPLGRRAVERYDAMPELSSRRARARAWLAAVTAAGMASNSSTASASAPARAAP
jgi:tetratricopeptide (TPR) repeat protein